MARKPDAIVVGAGPNGLSAALTLARAGLQVRVIEAAATPGGGARTEALTLPGFRHDVCSAAHPLGAASPFFRALELERHGLRWIHSPAPLAHPFDDGTAVLLQRDIAATAAGLGRDGSAWRALFVPLARDWQALMEDSLGPIARLPRHPLLMSRFGLNGLRSAEGLARGMFRENRARSLFAGIAAHSCIPLHRAATSAIGMMLALAGHVVGWPLAEGGSSAITDALLARLEPFGTEIVTGERVEFLSRIPSTPTVLLDVAPRIALAIADDRFPPAYRRRLSSFRHGPGVFKLDWALSGPIPWRARECREAATVHLGGDFEEIVAGERALGGERPWVLLVQPTLFDPTRAPAGKHVAWAYCHVPHGATEDYTARIEAQVERFAPGFRELILARSPLGPRDLEARNPNLIGGDISGGLSTLAQMLRRPVFSANPYRTPSKGIYLCSASTPPGPGVHGMCGHQAAVAALRDLGIKGSA